MIFIVPFILINRLSQGWCSSFILFNLYNLNLSNCLCNNSKLLQLFFVYKSLMLFSSWKIHFLASFSLGVSIYWTTTRVAPFPKCDRKNVARPRKPYEYTAKPRQSGKLCDMRRYVSQKPRRTVTAANMLQKYKFKKIWRQ